MLPQIHSSPDLVAQVHDALLDAICAGELAPGERFTQEQLAERLGVSRQPVLQALLLLRQQGLIVDTGNRRGMLVAPLDAGFVHALYAVRSALDALAARSAAAHGIDAARAAEGEAIVAHGRAAAARGDVTELTRADLAFHQFVYESGGNPVLVDTARLHWPHTRRVMAHYLRRPASLAGVWDEHAAILHAITDGDGETAARLSSEHAARSARMIDGHDGSAHDGTAHDPMHDTPPDDASAGPRSERPSRRRHGS